MIRNKLRRQPTSRKEDFEEGSDYYGGGEYQYNDHYDNEETATGHSGGSSCISQNEYDDFEDDHQTYHLVAFFCEFENYFTNVMNDKTLKQESNIRKKNPEFEETSDLEVSTCSILFPIRFSNLILSAILFYYLNSLRKIILF